MSRHHAFFIAAAIGLSPAVGLATPVAVPAPQSGAPKVTLVQGWWEQEGHERELRERYLHLPPAERLRYDQIQDEINRLEWRRDHELRAGEGREAHEVVDRIEYLRREEHRILRWGEFDHR